MQIYLPALPAVRQAFDASLAHTQLTFSAFIFAIGPAQLLYGPLADRFGRRPVLVAGMVLALAGSIACLTAQNMEWLIAARMLQAVGGASGLVIARAILSDIYDTEEMAGRLATVIMVMVVAPTVAPLAGGFLTEWYGWRSIFLVLAVLNVPVVAAILRWLPETLPRPASGEESPSLVRGTLAMLRRPLFHAYSLQSVFALGMFYVFISTVPYLMESVMGRSAQAYGMWFLVLALGYTLGNLTSSRYSRRQGIDWMIMLGSMIALLGAGTMIGLVGAGWWTPAALFLPMALITYSNGLCAPNAQTGAVRQAPQQAGTASSVVGFLQQTIGALLVQTVSMLNNDTPLTLSLFLMLTAVLAMACALGIRLLAAASPAR